MRPEASPTLASSERCCFPQERGQPVWPGRQRLCLLRGRSLPKLAEQEAPSRLEMNPTGRFSSCHLRSVPFKLTCAEGSPRKLRTRFLLHHPRKANVAGRGLGEARVHAFLTMSPGLLMQTIHETVVCKVWPPNPQHQCHLGTGRNCGLSGLATDLLNQKPWGGGRPGAAFKPVSQGILMC